MGPLDNRAGVEDEMWICGVIYIVRCEEMKIFEGYERMDMLIWKMHSV